MVRIKVQDIRRCWVCGGPYYHKPPCPPQADEKGGDKR